MGVDHDRIAVLNVMRSRLLIVHEHKSDIVGPELLGPA